jgi:hypothetical protein
VESSQVLHQVILLTRNNPFTSALLLVCVREAGSSHRISLRHRVTSLIDELQTRGLR